MAVNFIASKDCRHLLVNLYLASSEVKVAHSCTTLCDSMDYAVHGILQARILVKVKVKVTQSVWLFAIPWTVAHQDPLSIEFSRQEYWSGLQFPSPGDLPDPGIKPGSPALQADSLPSELLEWVAIPFSRGSSQPRDWTQVSRIAGKFFTSWATREAREYWSG